jgi:hypothetical protein
MKRFNLEADTLEEVLNYFQNRSLQLLRHNYFLIGYTELEVGVRAYFAEAGTNKMYQSLYLYNSQRGKRLYKTFLDPDIPVITSDECELVEFLTKKQIEFVEVNLDLSIEYHVMASIYGDDKANRSGVYLMNHIDEGLAILEFIGASVEAKKAYTIHPAFQSDEVLKNININNIGRIDSHVMMLVMEYRSVANDYLSKKKIKSIDEIRLSPLEEVNDMLFADKIQNRKDFELYHEGIHVRSKELKKYFSNWMKRLDINEASYKRFKSILKVDLNKI